MRSIFVLFGIFLCCQASIASETANFSNYGCVTQTKELPLSSSQKWENAPPTRELLTEVQGVAKSLFQKGACKEAEMLYALIVVKTDHIQAIEDDLRFDAITKLILIYLAKGRSAAIEPYVSKWLSLKQHETSALNSELGMAYSGLSEYFFMKDQFAQAEKYTLLAIKNVEVDERFFIGMKFHGRLRELYDHLAAVYYRQMRYAEGEVARTKTLTDPSKKYISTVSNVRPMTEAEKLARQRVEAVQLFSKGNTVEAIAKFRSAYESYVSAETASYKSLTDAKEKLENLTRQESNLTPISALEKDSPDVSQNVEKRRALVSDVMKVRQSIKELELRLIQEKSFVAASAFDLAEAYHHQQVYVDAEALYKISIAKLPPSFFKRKEVMSTASLGMLYREMGQYQESETMLKNALFDLRAYYGSLHPVVLEVENELAFVLQKRKNYKEAKELYLNHLVICESSAKPIQDDISRILLVLGDIELAQGNESDARSLYERAIAPYEANKEQNQVLLDGLKKLANLREQIKQSSTLKKTKGKVVNSSPLKKS